MYFIKIIRVHTQGVSDQIFNKRNNFFSIHYSQLLKIKYNNIADYNSTKKNYS